MQINFSVRAEGKTQDVSTTYADVIALEQKFDIDASELAKRQRASWLAYMAWHALKRTAQTTLSFEDWSNTLEDLDPKDESPNA